MAKAKTPITKRVGLLSPKALAQLRKMGKGQQMPRRKRTKR